MTTTKIDLLRHGLPEGDDCFRGHTDFKLTEKGMQQMLTSVPDDTEYDVVVSSPLVRCSAFAYHYADQHNIKVKLDPDFMELDFGIWDGVLKNDVWKCDGEKLSQFWSDPWQTTPPEGESLDDYEARILRAWNGMLEEHQGKRILLVTHGGVIKQLMRYLLDMSKTEKYLQRLNIPYAARVSVSVYQEENGKQWPEVYWPTA